MLEGSLEAALPLARRRHPYKSGNYAPIQTECSAPAQVIFGSLPTELIDSMYVRNGSNPSQQSAEADDFHWFDGDGMLSGVLFKKNAQGLDAPVFVNRFMLTDLYLASSYSKSRKGITPSIATLLSPISSLHRIVLAIFRTVFLCFLSFLTPYPIKRISVANTAILFHDGRTLATCESGPPLWVELPSLETIGWWSLDDADNTTSLRGKGGISGMIGEFTTAHPKSDPVTGELILYHCSFLPPHLTYSVIPSSTSSPIKQANRILAQPVPIPSPRMMHDFGVSREHTIIIDCPLSLDPLNLARGRPVVNYSPDVPTRFGIFPRHHPEQVRWFESESCCIFHTANSWSTPATEKTEVLIHVLCCRMNSSSLVYAAGNSPLPKSQYNLDIVEETCQLHYYCFSLANSSRQALYSFPLSSIPFEFPEVSPTTTMTEARYIYGCSMRQGSFSVALGQASKIDCLVKFNALSLINRGINKASEGKSQGPVDRRSVLEILASQQPREASGEDTADIRVFSFPPNHYAQEPSFVPRLPSRGEDDGFLLVYVFDENQLDEEGEAREDSSSELWVIDAYTMEKVVAKIRLPQRVPYGLHGDWFSSEQIASQRPAEGYRQRPDKNRSLSSLREAIIGRIQTWLD